MITASTSSRLTAEAIPAPSAATARSISSVASASLAFRARSQIPLVSRSRPCFFMILNRSVLRAALVLAAAPCAPSRPGPRRPPCSPAARRGSARRPLDDHVADLARRAAAEPGLAVQDQPAADPGAPEDARAATCSGDRRRAGTRPRSRPARRCPPRTGAPSASSSHAAELERRPPSRAGCAPGRPSRCLVHVPGRADPDARQLARLASRRPAPPPAAPRPSARRRRAGRPRVGVGRRAWPSTFHLPSTTTAWILVPPRSMPPRAIMGFRGLTRRSLPSAGLTLVGSRPWIRLVAGPVAADQGVGGAVVGELGLGVGLRARGRSAWPAPCRAPLPTGRRSRCPRPRPG